MPKPSHHTTGAPNQKKRILITDDDATFRQALGARCAKLGLEVVLASNGLDATNKAIKDHPDFIIMDINLPDTDGVSLCELIMGIKAGSFSSVAFVTGCAADSRIAKLEANGAICIRKGPGLWSALREVLSNELSLAGAKKGAIIDEKSVLDEPTPRQAPPPKILAVDDDDEILLALRLRLEASGCQFMKANDAQTGFTLAAQEKPDLIITDCDMPAGGGAYLIQRLALSALTNKIPVFVITGLKLDELREDHALERRMTSMPGVIEYFRKPIRFEDLRARIEEIVGVSIAPFPLHVCTEPVLMNRKVRQTTAFGRRSSDKKE